MRLSIRRLPNASDLPLPSYSTEGSAGLDLMAAIDEPISIGPGERRLIPTGIELGLPLGYEAQIRPRSGLALHEGITIPNSPGTIDSDYRGEIGVILVNYGQKPFRVSRGDRIAQMVLAPIMRVVLEEVEELPPTRRGIEGFGSTGMEREGGKTV